MLSRLLEAGPAQFSAPLGFMVSAVSASGAPLSTAAPVLLDSAASASTGLSAVTSHSHRRILDPCVLDRRVEVHQKSSDPLRFRFHYQEQTNQTLAQSAV